MGNTQDTVRDATNREVTVVIGEAVDYDGPGTTFQTDQALGATPTRSIALSTTMPNKSVQKFELTEVRYYMNPTNAVTYRLVLFEGANADDVQNLSDIVFDSGAAQADATAYDHRIGGIATATTVNHQLPVIVNLALANTLYYIIDWSGAPATTLGYIKIRGKLLK